MRLAKSRIARFFGAKAWQYAQEARTQRAALDSLRETVLRRGGPWYPVADLGCGVGLWNGLQEGRPMAGLTFGIDFSYDALRFGRLKGTHGPVVQADILHPPLRDGACSMAVLASVLQWSDDPGRMLDAVARILRARGYLAFSFFLRGSFGELLTLRSERGLVSPATYADEHEYAAMLGRSGFEVMESRVLAGHRFFGSARAALRSLSALGATATAGRRLGRAELSDLCGEYERRYRVAGGVPVTCSVLVGLARVTRHVRGAPTTPSAA